MQQVLVRNQTRPQVRPLSAGYCCSFFCRLRGLTFHPALGEGEGLLLVQQADSRLDAAIHMLGVWIDLAVVWINSARVVVDVRLAKRWRSVYIPRQPARFVLEIAPIRLQDFQIGDRILLEEVHPS
jgi:uncharacterized membrane protein (UPF0127 family)